MQPLRTTSLLRAEGLHVEYVAADSASVSALRDVSFTLEPSQSLGVLGESGSGKSTLALALMRLLPPNATVAGKLEISGRDLLRLPPNQLRKLRGAELTLISQEPALALNPVLSIGRQISDVLRAHSDVSKKDGVKRVGEILEQVGFEDPERVMRAYPHQLSGGQKQRAAIAQALVCRPSLLIADEPLSSLDTVTQAELLGLFRRLKSELNLSMIFISHDAAALSTVCDRVLVMKAGQAAACGAWEQIRASNDEYVRGLQFTSADCSESRNSNSSPVLNPGPVLEVRNLSKTYVQRHVFSREKFEIKALNDVSFGLKPNTTLAVIGRSGSGKSTLARCIAGFETPDKGEVLLEGKAVQKRSSIQMIFQDAATALNPRFTAAQLVAEPLEIASIGSRKERIGRALDLMAEVGLEKSSHSRTAGEFSGGQRQRLALARALAANPRVLIIDESLSGLDLSLQEQILKLLLGLQSRHNLSYLFISHDLRFLPMFAQEVLVMDCARVVDRVTPEALCRSSNPATRLLIEADEQLHFAGAAVTS